MGRKYTESQQSLPIGRASAEGPSPTIRRLAKGSHYSFVWTKEYHFVFHRH